MAPPQKDLDVLALSHHVMAALSVLFGLFPGVIYLVMGVAVATGRLGDGRHGRPPEQLFGWVFVAMGAALVLGALAYAGLLVLAGLFLTSRRHRTYCLVMAAISCAFFPFGTLLGVFTIMALSKPEVAALFEATAPPPPSTPPAAG
jgi:hypothetical protein